MAEDETPGPGVPPDPDGRSYGCSFGCGRNYDIVMVTVVDSTTLFLCIPCVLVHAVNVMRAMTEGDAGDVVEAIVAAGSVETTNVTQNGAGNYWADRPDSEPPDDEFEFSASSGVLL